MACTTSNTVIKGFYVAAEDANVVVGVVNTFGDAIEDADVTVDCGYDVLNDRTDIDGCVYFDLLPNLICDLTVIKDCYQLYEEKITVLSINDFDTVSNFPFKVLSNTGQAITSVNAELRYQRNGVEEVVSITPNTLGIYEAIFKYGFDHQLIIDAGSDGSINKTFNSFLKIDCEETAFRVVPLIQLT